MSAEKVLTILKDIERFLADLESFKWWWSVSFDI